MTATTITGASQGTKASSRSKTTLLVKNLPYTTTEVCHITSGPPLGQLAARPHAASARSGLTPRRLPPLPPPSRPLLVLILLSFLVAFCRRTSPSSSAASAHSPACCCRPADPSASSTSWSPPKPGDPPPPITPAARHPLSSPAPASHRAGVAPRRSDYSLTPSLPAHSHAPSLPPPPPLALPRRAFKGLAYKRFQHVPLYLEWAPLGVIKVRHPVRT